MSQRTIISDFCDSLSAHLMCFEYPGYGLCGGRAAEADCNALAEQAYAFLSSQLELKDEQILLVGQSIGTGVVTELARKLTEQQRTPLALVLISPLTSVREFAKELSSFGNLVFDRFTNLKKVLTPLSLACAASHTLAPIR